MNTKRRRKLGTSAKLAKCKNKQLPIVEQAQESGAVHSYEDSMFSRSTIWWIQTVCY
jgi:hypothetical protein